MNKLELQKEITKLEQTLTNPNLTELELDKITHWKGLLEEDLKNL